MSTLLQRFYLHCPYQRARSYLETALVKAASTGQPQVITLSVSAGFGTSAPGLEKDVLVTFDAGEDPMHFDQPWRVHWSPRNGGPYPDFDGVLAVRADYDYISCCLELRGEYEPPLGMVGAAFDAVAGSRIASATAREFLRHLGGEIETKYRDEEARKDPLANERREA